MGRSQEPAAAKGNLFLLPNSGGRRPRGGQPGGGAGFTHIHFPTHTLARTHTHPIVMWVGKGAFWLVGAGVWHRFEVFPAVGRLAAKRDEGESRPGAFAVRNAGE